jgi:Cu/Ag efflux pump CusA
MKPLAIVVIAGLLAATIVFSLLLDAVKLALFHRFKIA